MLFIFFALSIKYLGGIRTLLIVSISAAVFSIMFYIVWGEQRSLAYVFQDIFTSGSSIFGHTNNAYGEAQRDINRTVWFLSSLRAIQENWFNLLFGYGYRMSSVVVAPYVYELFIEYGVKNIYQNETVATEAITNFIVDGGLVGIILLIVNFFLTGLDSPVKIASSTYKENSL